MPSLRDLIAKHPPAEALDLPQALAYLEKRQGQMDYPTFQAKGWPIASGATESGNKLVVEARLKGAGMHWARTRVDPMLALRNVACNNRWDETWPQIAAQLRQQARERSAARRSCRAEARSHLMPAQHPAPLPLPEPAPPPSATVTLAPQTGDPTPTPHRPAANHPWRRSAVRRTQRSRFSAS